MAIVPPAARALHRFGGSWERIGDLLGREVMIAQAPEIAAGRSARSSVEPLRVAFLTMMGGNSRVAAVEFVLAQALIRRGHSVRMVLCDQQLPVCENKRAGMEESWVPTCAKCYAFGKAAFEAGELDVVAVSELLRGRAVDDRSWDEHVESALLKHYRVGRAPRTAEADTRRGALRTAARHSATVAQALVDDGIDRVVMSHGNYATWGPARDVFNEMSVPVLVHAAGTKKDSIRLHWRHDSFWQEISQEYKLQRAVPLTAAQSQRLDAYLNSRHQHSKDSHVYNTVQLSSTSEMRSMLELSDGPVFVLFANLMWDAASSQHALVYADPIEWILSTIDWFALNPDLQLVVRPHPAEVVFGTNESVVDVIAHERPSLPSNVRILPSDAPINSWSLIELATCGIVHTSTVGLELAIEEKPCVVVSDTHYRGKGFTYDIESREEYFRILRTLSVPIPRPETRELARRYAFILFMRYHMSFPLLYSPLPLLPVAYEAAVDGSDGAAALDLICRSIERLAAPLLPADASVE